MSDAEALFLIVGPILWACIAIGLASVVYVAIRHGCKTWRDRLSRSNNASVTYSNGCGLSVEDASRLQ